jgi:hypothetical protein
VQARYGKQYIVEPFGSTLYGVSSAASDLDLTIVRLSNLSLLSQ